MFPRAFDELKNAGIDHERIRSAVDGQIIFVDIRSALALPASIPALNGRHRKICYDFIRDNQIERSPWKIKLPRFLFYKRPRKATRTAANFQHVETMRVVQ